MMNIAAVPILNITLRNNLLDVIPIKPFIRKRKRCMCLLDDHKNSIKGLWSIILSIPVFIIVFLTRDVQTLVTYTGGFCGTFILLIFPAILVWFARKREPESKQQEENPNKSPFTSKYWIYLTLVWAAITITSVVVKIATGGGGE
jgi:amino acid permease